jgi:hypothetical protein
VCFTKITGPIADQAGVGISLFQKEEHGPPLDLEQKFLIGVF